MCSLLPLAHACWCLQAELTSFRSDEEVAELEQALCLLIKRASEIADAKAAKAEQEEKQVAESFRRMNPSYPDRLGSTDSLDRPGISEQASHAVHAEAGISKAGDAAGLHAEATNVRAEAASEKGSGSGISASSELISPEIEKQLPRAARRVSSGC